MWIQYRVQCIQYSIEYSAYMMYIMYVLYWILYPAEYIHNLVQPVSIIYYSQYNSIQYMHNLVQPIADRVAQHLELISKNFQSSTRCTRILMEFIIFYLVLIVNPVGRILVRWKSFRNNLEMLCHSICNWLYINIYSSATVIFRLLFSKSRILRSKTTVSANSIQYIHNLVHEYQLVFDCHSSTII